MQLLRPSVAHGLELGSGMWMRSMAIVRRRLAHARRALLSPSVAWPLETEDSGCRAQIKDLSNPSVAIPLRTIRISTAQTLRHGLACEYEPTKAGEEILRGVPLTSARILSVSGRRRPPPSQQRR